MSILSKLVDFLKIKPIEQPKPTPVVAEVPATPEPAPVVEAAPAKKARAPRKPKTEWEVSAKKAPAKPKAAPKATAAKSKAKK